MTSMPVVDAGRVAIMFVGVAVGVAGCDGDPIQAGSSSSPDDPCVQGIIDGGVGKDGIPALTDPPLVEPQANGAAYLEDHDRVIGIEVEGDFIAIPLNIGWHHEIVNLNLGDIQLGITHCPLTGSSLAFDRHGVGGAELGVSGLLFKNNLIMYDRRSPESLWPQMLRSARCGASQGTTLASYPVYEMTWAAWRELYPETRVVSSATGFARNYRSYPYGSYANLSNSQLLFPLQDPMDLRRLPKERVLGIPAGDDGGGIALP